EALGKAGAWPARWLSPSSTPPFPPGATHPPFPPRLPSRTELGQDHFGDCCRQFGSPVLPGCDHLERPAAAPEHDSGVETVRLPDGNARLITDAAQRLATACQPALIADLESIEKDPQTGPGRAVGILIV